MPWIPRKFNVIMRRKVSRVRRDVCRRILLWSNKLTASLQQIRTYLAHHPRWVLGTSVCLLISVSTVTIFFAMLWVFLRPLPSGAARNVVIPYASSAKGVAYQLEAEGIIRNATGFIWYLKLFHRKADLRAGVYHLKPGADIQEILKQLRKGSPLIYRVTIPEGYSLTEVTSLLAAKQLVNATRFLQIARDPEILSRYLDGFEQVKSAEGFLFPDTYEFAHGATEEEILAVFLRHFQEVWVQELSYRTGQRDLYNVLIMASIVEREAKAAEERPVIAGVFYNRLERRIPLESCATIQFALGKHKTRLFYKDLQVKSDYNTYRNRGLPPGPICSPGRDAMRAALAPMEHSFLYFVAKPDGKHHFSKSYREHLNAQRRIRQGKNP